MSLKRIGIYLSSKAIRPSFYVYTGNIESLYLKSLKKVNIVEHNYINLYLTSEREELGRTEAFGKFLHYYSFFDFYLYENLHSNYDKKKYVLEVLHTSILELCKNNNWDKGPFEEAFQMCFTKNLMDDWFFKNKLFSSPNKQYYIGLYHIVDIGSFEIYEVLFDKNKNELRRRKCFQDIGPVFVIGWASWESQNEVFFYKFNGPQKIIQCKINELLEGAQYNLSVSTSEFFKG